MNFHILLILSILTGSTVFAQQKPNFLWITVEDTSPQFIGNYGNKDARTPIIDKLANEGVRFTNAFATGSVCSPSRIAIITGVKTYKACTGNHGSKYTVPDFVKLLARLENDNLKDSTIIFFFADHGEGMPRGKTNGINYGYRIPFIIWFPEMYKHLSP